ncbi:MAG: hypothetical protein ACI9VT_003724 [Psychroserpens sp.]|jgi:hypothetical protein
MIGLIVFNVLFLVGCATAFYHYNRSANVKIGKIQDINAIDVIKRMSANNNNMSISINEKIDINKQLQVEVDILARKFTVVNIVEGGNVKVLANYLA